MAKKDSNSDPVFDDTGPSSSQTPYIVPAHAGYGGGEHRHVHAKRAVPAAKHPATTVGHIVRGSPAEWAEDPLR